MRSANHAHLRRREWDVGGDDEQRQTVQLGERTLHVLAIEHRDVPRHLITHELVEDAQRGPRLRARRQEPRGQRDERRARARRELERERARALIEHRQHSVHGQRRDLDDLEQADELGVTSQVLEPLFGHLAHEAHVAALHDAAHRVEHDGVALRGASLLDQVPHVGDHEARTLGLPQQVGHPRLPLAEVLRAAEEIARGHLVETSFAARVHATRDLGEHGALARPGHAHEQHRASTIEQIEHADHLAIAERVGLDLGGLRHEIARLAREKALRRRGRGSRHRGPRVAASRARSSIHDRSTSRLDGASTSIDARRPPMTSSAR